eukprot:m.263432 g.263432  ORF g.263432 m.263432 type:complete len:276 (+) comp53432_c0_seq1:147-974(+)
MSWCSVRPSRSGTRIMLRLACSVALRTASGTSFAMPLPKPTRPFWSPTTTSAAKPKRLPPLTVFETRLIATRRSANSGFSSRSSRRLRRLSRSAMDWHPFVVARLGGAGGIRSQWPRAKAGPWIIEAARKHPCRLQASELQATFAGGIGQGLDLPVEQEAATVKVAFLDAGRFRALGNLGANLGRGVDVVHTDDTQLFFQRRGRGDCGPLGIVDQLDADVLVRTVNRQAQTAIGGFPQFVPDALATLLEQLELFVRHLSRPYFFLPSLRKMYSPL